MIVDPCRPLKVRGGAGAALIGLLVTACTPQYLPPQQVQASNPTVTYRYYTDGELLQVNQTAVTFCNQYQASPRAATFAANPDGSKQVVFECVQPTAAMAMAPAPYVPNMTYTFSSDQELVADSQTAHAYCMSIGAQQMTSNIIANVGSIRTVTFQCGPT